MVECQVTTFRYRAARDDGERVAGALEAPSGAAAVALLNDRGLLPLEVSEDQARASVRSRRAAELAALFSGLAALLEAGLPVDRALGAAIDSALPATQRLLRTALNTVRQGSSLSAALDAAGGVPASIVGMLRAGEAHGRLAAAAGRAAVELERQAELHARLRAAMTYPAFLLATGGASVAVIVGVVVPRFATLLGDLGRALPPSTRLLIAISALLRSHGALLLTIAILVAAIGTVLLRDESTRARVDRMLLELPVIGAIRARLATARTCRSLSAMLSSGVPVLAALTLVQEGAADCEITRRLGLVRQDVSEGSRLDAALRRHAAITPTASRLARFGDESGRVADFLGQAARLEEAAAHRSLGVLISIAEPTVIVSFGALVAFVAAALLQAVYSVRPGGF